MHPALLPLAAAAALITAIVSPAGAQTPHVGRFDAAIITVDGAVITYRIDSTSGEVDACTRAGCVSSDRFSPTPLPAGAFKLVAAPDRVAVLDTTTGKLYTCDRVTVGRDGKAVIAGAPIFNCT